MWSAGRRRAVLAVAAAALTLAGCGDERQDADAPAGRFGLDVVAASFPARQRIAEPATLALEVENTGRRTVPQLAVTVETAPGPDGAAAPVAFGQALDDPSLASPARPVWIVDAGPAGGDSAYTNTWAVGPLAPGATRTVAWDVTPVRAGDYKLSWRLAPALEGDVTLTGGTTTGQFAVSIADAPVPARVGEDGQVLRD